MPPGAIVFKAFAVGSPAQIAGRTARRRPAGLVHGYTTAFWWGVAIFAFGAVVAAALFRWGPLAPEGQPVPADRAGVTGAAAQGSPEPGVIPG